MKYVERMKTIALLAQEPEVKEMMMLAAERIEDLTEWKLLWAQTHEELERVRKELEQEKGKANAGRGD